MRKQIFTTLLLLLTAITSLSAQQIMNGEAEIQNLDVRRNGNEVTLTMTLDVTDLKVGGDETLILTPAIEKSGHTIELPSVELMGRRAYLYFLRNGEHTATDSPLYADRIAKRAKRKSGKQRIDYTTTVAFEEWMRSAHVVIKQSSIGCDPVPILLGDNTLSRILHEPYKPQYLLTLIAPDPEPVKSRAEIHSAYINFRVDRHQVVEKYKNNATELASIMDVIARVQADADLEITSITIEGWASPEATEGHNLRLSQSRANSLADYVAERSGISREQITATGRGEDWTTLRKMVADMYLLRDKDKVLSIIDDESLTFDEKDARMKALVPSAIYQRIYNEVYPHLRRNDYRIEYQVRRFDLAEARRIIHSDPSKLSLDEMYRVARSYDEGSPQYNQTLAIAARTYPTVVAAIVNAAAALISEGKYDEAVQVLSRAEQSNDRVMNAMGYAYARKGDVVRASEWWDKAASQGNAEARHNLAELKKSLE